MLQDFEITGPYVGALMMSLGAVCIFIWAVLSGALSNTDKASQDFYEREMENDQRANRQEA
jgi:hypothetical protein